MRKLTTTIALALMLFSPFVLHAQETPQAEVFGGYQLLYNEGDNLHGFAAAVEGNLNHYFGIAGEFGLGTTDNSGTRYTQILYLAGPRLSYRAENFRVFGHVLLGGDTWRADSDSETYFAMTFGGGFDYSINKSFSIRLVQVDVLSLRVNSAWITDFTRFTTGIVYKFGNK